MILVPFDPARQKKQRKRTYKTDDEHEYTCKQANSNLSPPLVVNVELNSDLNTMSLVYSNKAKRYF